jgi:hypothetical protein
MDTLIRVRHYEQIAARYQELAKLAQLPYVSALYLTYAARYARMAEQVSRVQEHSPRIGTQRPRV